MLPRQHPRACPVTAVGPPSVNARDPRAFSVASFGPIEFHPRGLPPGWLASKCERTSRVSKWVSSANARGPRAIWSGSFGTNEPLKRAYFGCCPATNRGLSRDCCRAHLNKRARPPRVSGRFIWADRVPPARTADRLTAIQMRVPHAFPSGSPLQTREAHAQFGAVHSEQTSASRTSFSDVARRHPRPAP